MHHISTVHYDVYYIVFLSVRVCVCQSFVCSTIQMRRNIIIVAGNAFSPCDIHPEILKLCNLQQTARWRLRGCILMYSSSYTRAANTDASALMYMCMCVCVHMRNTRNNNVIITSLGRLEFPYKGKL